MTSHDALAAKAARSFTDALSGESSEWLQTRRYDDKYEHFKTYSEETVRAIIAMSSTPELYWNIDLLMDSEETEELISDYAHLCAVIERHGLQDEEVIVQIVHSLRWYNDLMPQGANHEYPKERLEQASAIIEIVASCLEHSGMDNALDDLLEYEPAPVIDHMVPLIQDKELLSLITGYNYSPLAISEIVTSRQVVDSKTIVALLEGNHLSLLEGAL